MPQLEIGDFAPQIVWLVITFVSLYLISWKLILPRIGDVLDAREERITDDLEEADKLKKAAEEALSTYEAAYVPHPLEAIAWRGAVSLQVAYWYY